MNTFISHCKHMRLYSDNRKEVPQDSRVLFQDHRHFFVCIELIFIFYKNKFNDL